MTQRSTAALDDLRSLTERYARYSRSAGGMSLVIGAVLVVAAFAVGAFVPLTPAMRVALAATPVAWLLAKELLRVHYYQRHGRVTEQVSPSLRRLHRWMFAYLCVVSTCVIAGVFWFGGIDVLRTPMLGYLVLVAVLPCAAWRWFWSVGDFLLGVLLFCQAAVVFAGGHYLAGWLWYVVACAAIAAVTGVREHRDYLRIRDALRRDR